MEQQSEWKPGTAYFKVDAWVEIQKRNRRQFWDDVVGYTIIALAVAQLLRMVW